MPGPPPAASGAPGAQAAQPPPAAAAHGWTEHKAPDGRTYYFHKAKGVSAWEKPDEMKTEQEKVVAAAMQGIVQSKWKEYTSATGKKYYFNTETRVTQWSMPDEMKAAADAAAAKAAAEAPAGAPAAAAGAAAGVVAEAAAAPPPRSLASTRSKGSLTNLVRSSKALLAKKSRAQPEDRSRREDV